jgi:hypothetical protein
MCFATVLHGRRSHLKLLTESNLCDSDQILHQFDRISEEKKIVAGSLHSGNESILQPRKVVGADRDRV